MIVVLWFRIMCKRREDRRHDARRREARSRDGRRRVSSVVSYGVSWVE